MGETREKVTIEFGADGTKLESGINGLERKVSRAGQKIQGAFQFRGDRQVKRQVGGFLQDMGSMSSAAEIAASASIHFGNALKLSLGPLIAVAIGATIYEKIADRAKAVADAQDKVNEAWRIGAVRGQSLSDVSKAREQIMASVKEMEGKNTFFGTAADQIHDFYNLVTKGKLTDKQGERYKSEEFARERINALTEIQIGLMQGEARVAELIADHREREAKSLQLSTKRDSELAEVTADSSLDSNQKRSKRAAISREYDAQIQAQTELDKLEDESNFMSTRKATKLAEIAQLEADGKDLLAGQQKIQVEYESKQLQISRNTKITDAEKTAQLAAATSEMNTQTQVLERQIALKQAAIEFSIRESAIANETRKAELAGDSAKVSMAKIESEYLSKLEAITSSDHTPDQQAAEIKNLLEWRQQEVDAAKNLLSIDSMRVSSETRIANLKSAGNQRHLDELNIQLTTEQAINAKLKGDDKTRSDNKIANIRREIDEAKAGMITPAWTPTTAKERREARVKASAEAKLERLRALHARGGRSIHDVRPLVKPGAEGIAGIGVQIGAGVGQVLKDFFVNRTLVVTQK